MGSPDNWDAEFLARLKGSATPKAMTAALAIRLRSRASFHKKLRQLIVNCVTKKAPASGRFRILICRIRGKF